MIRTPGSGSVRLVEAAVAPLHAEPRITSEQISQRVSGQRLTILAADGEWVRVRGADDYEGWIHRGYLLDAAPRDGWVPRCSLGCRTRRPGGAMRDLPAGAYLLPDEEPVRGEALDAADLRDRFPATPDALVRTALERFAGTSYEWGGITPWGADCSGMVQTVFRLHGVRLPRDARLQAGLGDRVEHIADAAAGDLLFFSERPDGRITHVGIALGRGAMVHCALGRGGHAVDHLASPADAYATALAARFRFACRFASIVRAADAAPARMTSE